MVDKKMMIILLFVIHIIPIIVIVYQLISGKSLGLIDIISWIVIFIIAISYLLWYTINWLFIKKVKDLINDEKYVGVVLTNNTLSDKFAVYGSGVMILIKYLQKNQISHKIIKKSNLEIFKEFIYDKNCYGLYIIGHGSRQSLKISKNETCEYSNFKDAPKKEFIVQLHCNHKEGESLADIIALNKEKSYVPSGKQYIYFNILYFVNLFFKKNNVMKQS